MKKTVILISITLMFLLAACQREEPKTTPVPAPAKKAETVKAVINYNVLNDIKLAKEMLAKEDAGFAIREETRVGKVAKPKKVKGKKAKKAKPPKRWKVKMIEDFNVLLAVEDIVKQDRKIQIIKLTNKGKKSPRGFAVDFKKANGVNTTFDVAYPEGYAVLAIKRVVRANKKEFEEAVYTPFTKELDIPLLRRTGLGYTQNTIILAQDNLRAKAIKSLAYGGLVADEIPPDVSLTLSVIEHIDPPKFIKGEMTPEQLVNEVLVTIGANQDKAYNYSVSPAGARGLFQFIPKTYKSIYTRYPKAGLIQNLKAGMNDHNNAAMASLLLFDSDLCSLTREHRNFLKQNPEAMGKYLAASYNGGAKRAANAIKKYGPKWEQHLLPETKIYLKKFDAAWKILHA